MGINADGSHEVFGVEIDPSDAVTFWTCFLHKLGRRNVCCVSLVASDSHEGIKGPAAKILTASLQRCRTRFMRKCARLRRQ